MSRQVVFGTGQVGSLVVTRLVSLGHDVVAVNRSGRGSWAGARVVGIDATDIQAVTEVATGADVVYFCLNAASYTEWPEQFPPLQRAVMAAAEHAGARMVVLDNLYAYGPTAGEPLVETLAARPSSAKAETRAAMTQELLEAHAAGRVEVTIGRASDYFGPGTTESALGQGVFGRLLQGHSAQVMGDPDTLHSYSFTPDVAAGLVTLGSADGATGAIWHLPVAPARTTREIVASIADLAGARPRCTAVGRTGLRLVGLAVPAMREYRHTLYQFTDPWVVDDSRFRTAFAAGATPLDEALATTVDWFRTSATTA